jgi:hypothetical protein
MCADVCQDARETTSGPGQASGKPTKADQNSKWQFAANERPEKTECA